MSNKSFEFRFARLLEEAHAHLSGRPMSECVMGRSRLTATIQAVLDEYARAPGHAAALAKNPNPSGEPVTSATADATGREGAGAARTAPCPAGDCRHDWIGGGLIELLSGHVVCSKCAKIAKIAPESPAAPSSSTSQGEKP